MAIKRKIEIFSAGCEFCNNAVILVKEIVCESCEITVFDMQDPGVSERARSLGIRSIPAVVIDGKLADCCTERGINEATLRKAGIGQPIT